MLRPDGGTVPSMHGCGRRRWPRLHVHAALRAGRLRCGPVLTSARSPMHVGCACALCRTQVDFGQELEHSPDGKAYIVGHGASRPEAVQAWMLGDAVYMARVNPTVQDIADRTKWEFYGGGSGDSATWITGDVSKAQPLVTWNNHTGTTTMTYFPALKKYILTISTASYYPSMVKQFET